MEINTNECCICNEKFQSILITEVLDLLIFIIEKINCKLIKELFICETCLAKVQQAYEFKKLYLNKSQNAPSIIVQEKTDMDNFDTCEMCKNIVNPSDSIALFYSPSKNGVNLMKYLSIELINKVFNNSHICEACYNSILNFYTITKPLYKFDQDNLDKINELSSIDEKIESTVDSQGSCGVYIKEEMDYVSNDIKEENLDSKDAINHQKNEEIHLKMEDNEIQAVESTQQQNNRSIDLVSMTTTICPEIKTCHICNIYETSNMDNLKKHFILHQNYSELPIFVCQVCEFQTISEKGMKKHMKMHETKKQNQDPLEIFKCEICEHTAKSKRCLKAHMIVHKNADEVKLFGCELCEFKSKHRSTVNRHTLIHKDFGETQIFICYICNFKTKRKHSLKEHIRIIHDEKVETFKCHLCDYETKCKKNLASHMLKHKRPGETEMFQCHICKFQTKYKRYLKNHVNIHKDDDEVEMFKCQSCDYQARYKSYMKHHVCSTKKGDKRKRRKKKYAVIKMTQKLL